MTAGLTGLFIGVGAFCVSVFCTASAEATTGGFTTTLGYETTAGCPRAEAFEAIVAARVGYDPFVESATHHVFLSIAPSGASLNGRIEWRDADGQWSGDQSFSMLSGDCLRLIRTMGLALAVQIQLLADPAAAPITDSESTSEPQARPTAFPEARRAEPPQRQRSNSDDVSPATGPVQRASGPSSPVVFAMGAGPSVAFGMGPHPILIGRVFGMLSVRQTSVDLAAEVSVPTTTRRSDGAGVSVKFRVLSATGCRAIERVNACFLVNAGTVVLAGEDIDRANSAQLPFVAVGARAAFLQPLGPRLFVKANANALVILTRSTARLDDVPIWTMPRFALSLGIDVGVNFR